MMVIVKCYPRLEGNMGENVFKDRRLCWRRSDNELLCFFSYTANTDRTSCNSGGSTEVIAVMYGVYVAVLLREQATACGLPCQLSSWTNAQVCLLSFACETKTRWECSSQTVSCARQRVVIAIERLCVSAHSSSLSVFLFLPVAEDWWNSSTSLQSSPQYPWKKFWQSCKRERDARCALCLLCLLN